MNTTLKCNLCETGEMEHVQIKKTSIYVCEQCPNIQLEYYSIEDAINFEKYMNGELKALSLVEIYYYMIADYIGYTSFDGDYRQLGKEVFLVAGEGSDLVTNIYESHTNIDIELLERVIHELVETGDNVIYTEVRNK